MRVVLVEKPRDAKRLHDAYVNLGVTEATYFICTYGITPFKPVWPLDLKWTEFPVIQDVQTEPYNGFNKLQPDKFTHCLAYGQAVMPDDSRNHISLKSCRRLISKADEIIFACAPDVRGVASFEQFIHEFAPERNNDVFSAYFLNGLSPESLAGYIREPSTTAHQEYWKLKNAALVKRHFEHNFMLNSQSVLMRTYKKVGGKSDVFISKYQIQLLYWLRQEALVNRQHKIESLFTHMDRHWSGTGKYKPSACSYIESGILGSPSSRQRIIDSLIEKGLISHVYDNFILTSLGHEFLSALHPDCMDLDLPFRLSAWMEKPFKEVRPAIDSYLRRYFSRQMRFMTKT